MDIDNSIFDNLEDLVISKTNYQNNDFFLNLNEINHYYNDDPTFIHMNLLRRHNYNDFNNFIKEMKEVLLKKEKEEFEKENIKKDKIINNLIFMGNQSLNSSIFWKQNFDKLLIEYRKLLIKNQKK